MMTALMVMGAVVSISVVDSMTCEREFLGGS